MTKKCGDKHIDVWGETYFCNRSKEHHGDHTHSVLWPWYSNPKRQQWYFKTTKWPNQRYCGVSLTGAAGWQCEKPKGHKGYHKAWVLKRYIEFKLL